MNAATPPAEALAPTKRYTREEERFLLSMIQHTQELLAECRAGMAAQEAERRSVLREQRVVSLADWRKAEAPAAGEAQA